MAEHFRIGSIALTKKGFSNVEALSCTACNNLLVRLLFWDNAESQQQQSYWFETKQNICKRKPNGQAKRLCENLKRIACTDYSA